MDIFKKFQRKVDFFNILTKVEIYTKWEGGGGVWGRCVWGTRGGLMETGGE